MTPTKTPSGCLRIASLLVATIAGVVVVVGLWTIRSIVGGGPMQQAELLPLLNSSFVFVVVGSIVAMPFCMLIGLPLWSFAIRSGRQQHRDAMRFGLMAGALIGAVLAVVGDAWPSLLKEALDFLGYCVAGLCAGSVAYRAAYSS